MFFWDILTLVDAFKGFKKLAHDVIIVEGGGVVSTIFCGALAGKISRLRPKRNSAYRKDRSL